MVLQLKPYIYTMTIKKKKKNLNSKKKMDCFIPKPSRCYIYIFIHEKKFLSFILFIEIGLDSSLRLMKCQPRLVNLQSQTPRGVVGAAHALKSRDPGVEKPVQWRIPYYSASPDPLRFLESW